MADDEIEDRVEHEGKPDPKRVASRAKAMKKARGKGREGDIQDKEAAAERLLGESQERTELDPAPRDLKEDRVERRTSEDATPPPDGG
jgi:hypothetical protein